MSCFSFFCVYNHPSLAHGDIPRVQTFDLWQMLLEKVLPLLHRSVQSKNEMQACRRIHREETVELSRVLLPSFLILAGDLDFVLTCDEPPASLLLAVGGFDKLLETASPPAPHISQLSSKIRLTSPENASSETEETSFSKDAKNASTSSRVSSRAPVVHLRIDLSWVRSV